jgi:hypothetical protein
MTTVFVTDCFSFFRILLKTSVLYSRCFQFYYRIRHLWCPRRSIGAQLNGTHHVVVCADGVTLLDKNMNAPELRKEGGLEENA